jgi:hypothetical protein
VRTIQTIGARGAPYGLTGVFFDTLFGRFLAHDQAGGNSFV